MDYIFEDAEIFRTTKYYFVVAKASISKDGCIHYYKIYVYNSGYMYDITAKLAKIGGFKQSRDKTCIIISGTNYNKTLNVLSTCYNALFREYYIRFKVQEL
jgi:hypothetical protein